MPAKRTLRPESVWDTNALLQALANGGFKQAHAFRIWGHLLRHPEATFEDVPDLPVALLALLKEQFTRSSSAVTNVKRSDDGDTTKLLVTLQDGMQVEVVIMTYDTRGRYNSSTTTAAAEGPDDEACTPTTSAGSVSGMSTTSTAVHHGPKGHRRATLCVSSQVGCNMGCTFCSTGTMGLKGNLTSGEIIEQLVHARNITAIRNIVFMGMGEPLNNYDAVRAAVLMMTDSRLFSLARSQVTISTVGVVPKIALLPDDLPGVSLALSLHAPTQELRHQIVPSARLYKLDRLMAAVLDYEARSKLRVFVEYVMLAGVNDGAEQAHQLGQLLQGHNTVCNLIPWNPVYSPNGPKFSAPAEGSVAAFHSIVRSYGIACTIRQEKGQDISGACGQLVLEVQAAGGSGGGKSCSAQVAAAGEKLQALGVRDIEELGAAQRAV